MNDAEPAPEKYDPTPLLAKRLGAVHAVGTISALILLVVISADYHGTEGDHLIKTEIYTRSVGFSHPCGALPPGGNATTYFAGCISKDAGIDNNFILVPGETTNHLRVSPYLGLLLPLTFSVIYHGLLVYNFWRTGTPVTKFFENVGSKFVGVHESLKSLRYFRNVIVVGFLVWSIMCLVGVGNAWEYIITGGMHLGLFAMLAQWDRDQARLNWWGVGGYLTLATISSWYIFAATNHEDNTLSDAVPSHFQLALISGVHATYIFLYGLHLMFLRLTPLDKFWDVQVDIGFAILNVGYLITIVVGVYANYKEISKGVFERVYPDDFVDDMNWYDVQDIVTSVTSTVVLLAVLFNTFAAKRCLANRTGITATKAKDDYGYVRSKYSTNTQPHEGEPILGEQYAEEA